MAIDNNAKKLSLITMGVPWYTAGPLLAGSFDEDEFRTLLHLYFGVDAVPADLGDGGLLLAPVGLAGAGAYADAVPVTPVISEKGYLISVWDDVECAGGSALLSHVVGYNQAIQNLSLSTDEQMSFTAPGFQPFTDSVEWDWVGDLAMGNVIRIDDPLTSDVTEWRIHSVVKQQDERGMAIVQIQANPILLDLKKYLVETEIDGCFTYRNLGVINLSPQQIIDTFIINMANNPSWIVRGTVTPTQQVELAWEGYTALELLRDLAEKFPDYELRLRRNGATDYRIDIAATGSGVVGPPVQFGRNLLSLTEREWTHNFATVLVPRGRMPQGDIEFGGITDNVWKITAKSSGDLTLEDPAEGDGPIGYDDQLNGLFLESATEITREEITDSVLATQVVTVADATDYAVGDQCRISKAATGTLISELTHPVSLATYGRVVGTLDFPDQPASRNYHPSGAMHHTNGWNDVAVYFLSAHFNGIHSATTTLALKDLPIGLVIEVGALINQNANPAYMANVGSSTWGFVVTVGGTVSGAGEVSLTIDTNITGADGEPLGIVTGLDIGSELDSWPTIDDSGTDLMAISSSDVNDALDEFCLGWTEGTGPDDGWPTDVVGTVDGNHGGALRYLDVTGLAVDTYYPPGFTLYYDDNVAAEQREAAVTGFYTDGSGSARLWLNGATLGQAADDGNAMRVEFPADVSAWGVKTGDHVLSAGIVDWDAFLQFDGVPVRYTPGRSTLYVGTGVSIYNFNARTWAQGTSPYMPKIELDTRLLGSATGFDTSTFYAAGSSYGNTSLELLHHDYSGSLTIAEDKEVIVRVYPYRLVARTYLWPAPGFNQTFRYFSMWLGPESDPPITPGSEANILWQKTNRKFPEVATPEVQYSMTLRDLSSLPGFEASAEKPVLGSVVPVLDEKLGINVDARIVAITFDLVDRMNSRIFLERTITLATKNMLNPRFTVRRSEAGQSAALSGPEARPAVREDGALRSSAPADAAGGVVPPEEYES